MVTSCPPKLTLVGLKTATDALAVPVPVSVADCGLLGSTSVNTRVAVSADATDEVNVILTVQDMPAGKLAPQVPPAAMAKSAAEAGGVPATMAMLLMVSTVELLLVKVMVCGAVVAPISCVPKSTLSGDTTTGNKSGSLATNASESPLILV